MAVDPQRLREELREMKKRIKEDPEVLARFDADGNGVIDGDEWEQVRQLVIQRLEREASEAAAAAAAAQEASDEPETDAQGRPVVEAVMHELSREAVPTSDMNAVRELVLQQEGGVGQVFENMARRSYRVLDPSEQVIASIQQSQSGMALGMQNVGQHLPPDMDFAVTCPLDGEMLRFRRSVQYTQGGLAGALRTLAGQNLQTRIGVLNEKGNEIAHARYEPGFVTGTVHVFSTLQKNGLTVTPRRFKPFTFDIAVGERVVGTMERGWTGLGGFLTGGNQIHVEIAAPLTRELVWGLIAGMVLVEMGPESQKDDDDRGSLFSF